MHQQLYLLRHAKAEPCSPLGNDFSRALSEKGINDARLVAGWARDTLPLPDTVLCSTAKRTRQTLAPCWAIGRNYCQQPTTLIRFTALR